MLDQFFQFGPLPANQLLGTYDPGLVILSYLVATFASYIALDIVGRLRDVNNTKFSIMMWLLGGAFAMGAGIWSMHFIGMLAFSMPSMPMNYALSWTVISMAVAILASGFGLYLLKDQSIKVISLVLGGIILGISIVSMHYLGMEAMKGNMNIHYLPSLFILSILIAIFASEAAIWLAIKSNQAVAQLRVKLKVISAFIMGGAIVGMHYTGMAAAVFTPNEYHTHIVGSLNQEILAISIAGVTFIILGIAFFASTYKEALNQQLLLTARQAGMAEVAASVLHNVGNVLNSISVSATILNEKITKSKLDGLSDLSALFSQHKDDLSTFINQEARGNQIVEYLTMLSSYWEAEKLALSNETQTLKKNIEHIKNIISMQQEFSKSNGFEQLVSIKDVLEESLVITGLDRNKEISVKKNYQPLNPVLIDKVKLLQVLVNILRNAKDALIQSSNYPKKINLVIEKNNKDYFYIQIIDNGIGILSKNVTKIFGYGFTTKTDGHGFGLHSSAIAINDMGGSIKVTSEGENQGATFTIDLPYRTSKKA